MAALTLLLLLLPAGRGAAQPGVPMPRPRPAPVRPPAAVQPAKPETRPRPGGPGAGEILVSAIRQEAEWPWRRLRGRASVETTEMLLSADEIDYNSETDYAEARGNVRFVHFEGGEEIFADKVEYDMAAEKARYYNIRGSSPAKIETRPGILASTSPFSFQGRWAERIENRYLLHEGFITNCKLPRPTWVLAGPVFEIVPNERAVARRAVFRVRRIPLFYAPIFYKSLEKQPRKSGFLTPNAGNSSRRGKMIGAGYYWAINRSYDATYRAQYFTQRGVAHHVDIHGKPLAGTDFNAILYGVNDRGLQLDDGTRRKEGGYIFSLDGHSELPWGFYARGEINYLSSFQFRQAFTESFYEAIFSEVHSVGFVTKHWSSYSLNLVLARNEIFQSTQPDDKIVIRKLPQLEFRSRDRQVRQLPVWISLQSAAGLVRRTQPLFQTRQFVERLDLEPRVMTAVRWKDVHLIPSLSVRETYYGSTQGDGKVVGQNQLRSTRELGLQLVLPSLARIFEAPGWLPAAKLKHVIEPRAGFRWVGGVEDFNDLIRFDETELLSNTREVEFTLINRLFAKARDGQVSEVLSWQLWHRRFFDPDFGGAVAAGRRNVVLSASELTGYTFLAGPRRYSPIVSAVRLNPTPALGIEWRADYDPLYGRMVNSGMTADARVSKYFISAGHNRVTCVPLAAGDRTQLCSDPASNQLSPASNQFRGIFGIGNPSQRGWGAAFTASYDFRTGVMQYATTQVTFNNDCCGISFQYRRFNFGTRNENQFRVAFAIANIGTFGTLKKQERLF